MKSQYKWLIAAVLFVALLLASLFLYNKLAPDNTPANGALQGGESSSSSSSKQESSQSASSSEKENEYVLAPDFTVFDSEGNEVKLSDMRGKPVVINFWATWCGYCVMEMPDFEKVYGEYGEDIHFMMIDMTNARETKEAAEAFIAEEGFTFPVYYDINEEAAIGYGIRSLPTSIFIDSEGYIKASAQQMIDEKTILQGIGLIQDGATE